MTSPTAPAPAYATDEQLQQMITGGAAQDVAQRLGLAHMQHAEANAAAGVFHQQLVSLRAQVDQLTAQRDKAELDAAQLRHQLGLSADAAEDPAHPDPSTAHRLAASLEAPHAGAAPAPAHIPDEPAEAANRPAEDALDARNGQLA